MPGKKNGLFLSHWAWLEQAWQLSWERAAVLPGNLNPLGSLELKRSWLGPPELLTMVEVCTFYIYIGFSSQTEDL